MLTATRDTASGGLRQQKHDDTSAPGCEEDDLEKENGNLPLTVAPLDKFEWWLADDPDPPLEAEKHPDVFRLVDPFSTCC